MKNNVGTTSLIIKWKKPRDQNPSSYHVTYKAIKVAAVPVSNATLHEVVLNGSSTMIHITGLESYTTYNITVTPIGRSGVRMKSTYVFAGRRLFLGVNNFLLSSQTISTNMYFFLNFRIL